MQRYTRLEISVGVFVTLGAAALAYLSLTLGGLRIGGGDRYELTARFSSVGSLKKGDPVRIAGVTVGEVSEIRLVDFVAQTKLLLERSVTLPTDTIASVKSEGLLGDSYVSLSPGAAEQDLKPGGKITRSEPAVNVTELIAKYAFGSPVSESKPKSDAGAKHEDTKKSPLFDPLE